MYKKATLQIPLYDNTNKIKIKRGMRKDKGIGMGIQRFKHCRIILISFKICRQHYDQSETDAELEIMLMDVHRVSTRIDLELNSRNTKYMTNLEQIGNEAEKIMIGKNEVERAFNYKYIVI